MNPTENDAKAASVPVTGSKDGKKTLLKIRAAAVPKMKKSYHSGHRSFPQIREILIRADAHRSLDCVIPHEKLGQRQGMALCAVGQIDAAHFVAQMSRLRDEVP